MEASKPATMLINIFLTISDYIQALHRLLLNSKRYNVRFAITVDLLGCLPGFAAYF